MIRLSVLFLALLAADAWGAGSEPNEILFVRPSAEEYGAEDGTTYATAFDGRTDINVTGTPNTVGALDVNDTLVVCGEFDDGQWNPHSGTAGNPVIYDGDCSAYGGPAKATIRNTAGNGVIVGNANTNWTWRNVIAIGSDTDTIATVRLGNNYANTFNIVFEDSEVYGTPTRRVVSNGQCMRISGVGITVDDTVIQRCSDDGIYAEGSNHELTDLRITDIDTQTGADGGDCIQYPDGAGVQYDHTNIAVRRLYCENYGVLIKQGVIFGCDNTGGPANSNILLEDSNLFGIQTGASSVYVKYCSGVTIRRSHMASLGIGNTVSQVVNVESNIFDYRRAGTVASSEVVNTGAIRVDSGTTAGTINIRNNTILTDANFGYGIYVAPTGSTVAVNTYNNNIVGPITIAGMAGRTGQTWTSARNNIFGAAALYASGEVDETGAGDTSVDPQFVGGSAPSGAQGFKLRATSPLRRAGVCVLTTGCVPSDFLGRRARVPPDVGAWQRN